MAFFMCITLCCVKGLLTCRIKPFIMVTRLLSLLVLAGTMALGQAQVPEAHTPFSWGKNIAPTSNAKTILPTPDLQALRREDAILDQDKSNPYRFGAAIPVDIDLTNSGEWTVLKNGDNMWRLNIASPGSHTVNFYFDWFDVPAGAVLHIYNDDRTEAMPPLTSGNMNDYKTLATFPMNGDNVWLEYIEPAAVAGQGRIDVATYVYGYRTIGANQAQNSAKALNDSGACNVDIDCDITPADGPGDALNQAKENVKKSEGMVVVNGATGICSGALINNTANDGTPYFLTANHCLGSETSWAYRFNWRSPNPSCATTTPSTNGTFDQTASGGVLRAANSNSDMALMEINDTAFFAANPDVVFAGWDRSTTAVPTAYFGAHHPSGDIAKSFTHDGSGFRQTTSFNGDPNTAVWRLPDYSYGVTEPGSSGSPLFNQDGRIVADLSGGAAACNGTNDNNQFDIWGRFDVAWGTGAGPNNTRLEPWLDPQGTGVIFLDQNPPVQALNLDASIAVTGASGTQCGTTVIPAVNFTNFGATTVTSITYTYSYNGGAPTTATYTGNITTGSSAAASLPPVSSVTGANTVDVAIVTVNGVVDDNAGNNNASSTFDVPTTYVDQTATLTIMTDDWANETTWELTDDMGAVLQNGGANYVDFTTYNETLNFPSDGCYTFTIFDTFGDGICCNEGNGSYSISIGGQTLSYVGDFGSSESTILSVDNPVGFSDEALASAIQVYPNPSNGDFKVALDNVAGDVDYTVVNMLGQQVTAGSLSAGVNDVSMNVGTGVYFIQFNGAAGSFTHKLVVR